MSAVDSREVSRLESRLLMRKRLAEMKSVLVRCLNDRDIQTDTNLVENAYQEYCNLLRGESN